MGRGCNRCDPRRQAGVFGDPNSRHNARAGAAKNSDCCVNDYKKIRPKQGSSSFEERGKSLTRNKNSAATQDREELQKMR
jgi:hypothetical protein